MKTWVIIPAYNERFSLEILLRDIREKGISVLVVDDGSVDDTYKIAKEGADAVIKNNKNLGKGMSLNKGISYLMEEGNFDCVITMDADGQHAISDIDIFIEEAEKGASFIVGNRMHNPIGMPKLRVITNKFMSWFISKIVKQNIPDTQCGFRLIKKEVLKKMVIETNKFEIESELIIKAAWLGFIIKSIPVESIYFKNRSSKINPFGDTFRFLKFIFCLGNGRK